ncbi:MAG: LacI family DNA-binding transcriptional regulator [bacterium]
MLKTLAKGSIYDVARVSGVSIGTVSRVFNSKPDVAEKTRTLVIEAAKQVNYMPRIGTRRVNIGLVVQEIEKANEVGFVSHAISTLVKHMAMRGGVLELVQLDNTDAIHRNCIRGLIAVFFGPDTGTLGAIRNMPIVSINNDLPGDNVHTVASDHAQGAYMATKYLLDRGHKKIGFLEIQSDGWVSKERQRGYKKAFDEAGVARRVEWMSFCGHEPARNSVIPLMESKPTALLVCGEDLSLAVNHVLLHELKIRIPDDLSVITFETSLVSALLTPPQTTVCQPWEDLGRAAVDTIFSLVENKQSAPIKLFFPNKLIERSSVRTL